MRSVAALIFALQNLSDPNRWFDALTAIRFQLELDKSRECHTFLFDEASNGFRSEGRREVLQIGGSVPSSVSGMVITEPRNIIVLPNMRILMDGLFCYECRLSLTGERNVKLSRVEHGFQFGEDWEGLQLGGEEAIANVRRVKFNLLDDY